MESLFEEPPEGKTVILLGSRGGIEDLFVRHMPSLEERGIAFICQNLSGGQGRMQAEFAAAKSPAIWLLTPWTFEGVELPPASIDHLVIGSLPFDSPSHPVMSRRAERYADSFAGYILPRLLHRLFRLLRTFCRYRTEGGDVIVIDERLRTKKYGKDVRKYLERFAWTEKHDSDASKQLRLF
jgi:ATP-dependent DNA helicase DinG